MHSGPWDNSTSTTGGWTYTYRIDVERSMTGSNFAEAWDGFSRAARKIRDSVNDWLDRFAGPLRRIVESLKELREALEKAERARVPRELYVVPMFFLRIGPASQSALAPRIRFRACERQAVPSRTRRKLRTWERAIMDA